MEEKPKIMKTYERLYSILTVTYFLLATAIIFFMIDGYFREVKYENSLFMVCIIYGVPVVIVCILCGIFSLRIWKAIKKGESSSTNDVFGLSLASLFLFGFLAFFSYGLLQSPSDWLSGWILVFLFLFLTIIIVIIIAVYFTPQVRAIRKSSDYNK